MALCATLCYTFMESLADWQNIMNRGNTNRTTLKATRAMRQVGLLLLMLGVSSCALGLDAQEMQSNTDFAQHHPRSRHAFRFNLIMPDGEELGASLEEGIEAAARAWEQSIRVRFLPIPKESRIIIANPNFWGATVDKP